MTITAKQLAFAAAMIVVALVAVVAIVSNGNNPQPPAANSAAQQQQEVPPTEEAPPADEELRQDLEDREGEVNEDILNLDVLEDQDIFLSCEDSDLDPHDGTQTEERCSATQFGEVPAEDQVPQLIITDYPDEVDAGEEFEVFVSTRNLVRDIFLPGGDDLYYAAPGSLDRRGNVEGHVHMACRILEEDDEAPPSEPEPLFFSINDDGGGSDDPDEFSFVVPGIDVTGELQCSVWAGDASHRIPLQVRANQTPAFDSVRIEVE